MENEKTIPNIIEFMQMIIHLMGDKNCLVSAREAAAKEYGYKSYMDLQREALKAGVWVSDHQE